MCVSLRSSSTIAAPAEERRRPDQRLDQSPVRDHLGLVAGLVDERGRGESSEQATPPHPDLRDLTVGEAVKAMGLHGLGWITHALSWGPRGHPSQLKQ